MDSTQILGVVLEQFNRQKGHWIVSLPHSMSKGMVTPFDESLMKVLNVTDTKPMIEWALLAPWADRSKISLSGLNGEELYRPKEEGGMGFKNLVLFNDALLAKQVWWLLHNKTSLFYRIFKSIFFSHYSIMEAQDSTASSYD